jgi:hypothetical protein
MTNSTNTPPAPTTRELFGSTPTYTPTPGITEHANGVPELRSPDMHETVTEDEALEKDDGI